MAHTVSDRPAGLLVWANADQASLIVAVARRLGRPVHAVGGPGNGDGRALVAAVTAAEPGAVPPEIFRDLRHVVSTLAGSSAAGPVAGPVAGVDQATGDRDLAADRPIDRVLVAARGSLEPDERAALRSAGVPVVSLEPRPARLADFLAESAHDEVVRLPRLTAGPAWRLAADAITEFGRIDLLEIAMASRPEEGSLHARLHDAMDVVDRLVTHPTGVAAGMSRGPGDVPEHLAGLRGSMTVQLRGDDGWCAAIACSDAGPAWSRRVVATGPAGRFVLDDEGFVRHAPDGRLAERLPVRPPDDSSSRRTGDDPACGDAALDAGATAIAESVARPLRDPIDPSSRGRRVRRFALCEAARLAARTGERESPARLADVLGGGADA